MNIEMYKLIEKASKGDITAWKKINEAQNVENNETLIKIRRKFYNDCVEGTCVLCGKNGKYTKSHSIPKRNMKKEKKIYNLSNIIEQTGFIHGVYDGNKKEFANYSFPKSTGIFKNICSTCDNANFIEYEKSGVEFTSVTNKQMAEIVLKSELSQEYSLRIQKYTIEKQIEILKKNPMVELFKNAQEIIEVDINENKKNIESACENNNNTTTKYKLLLNKKFSTDYSIYVNTSVVPFYDKKGKLVNNLYNLKSKKEGKKLYFFIIPEHDGLRCIIFTNNKNKYNYGFNDSNLSLESIIKLFLFYSPKIYFGESMINNLDLQGIKQVYNLYNIQEHVINSKNKIPSSTLKRINKNKFLEKFNELNNILIFKN